MPITSGRGYTAGSFALEIEGQVVAFATSVEGGSVYGKVTSAEVDADGVVRKNISGVGYDPIVVTCGVPEGVMGDWIKDFLEGKPTSRDGSIVFLNYSYQQTRRLVWQQGTITSVSFPKLDGAGKEAAQLTVTISPESTSLVPATGAGKTASGKSGKAWLTSNFVVEIPGVDCSRVASVAPLTISWSRAEDLVGEFREPTKAAGSLHVGDLVLSVAEVGAAGFAGWRDDFIVNGNNGRGKETTATVTFKSPNLKDDLFSLVLDGVGIHRLDPDKQVQGTSSVSRLTASLYCEKAALTLPKQPAAPAPAPGSVAGPGSAAGTGTAPGTGATEGTRPLRSRLGEPGEGRLEAADVARRLLTTADPHPVAAATDRQRQRGTLLGATWAQRMASLDELTQLAAMARGDWTAIALADGHSLIDALQESGVVPTEHTGDLELARDSFVEGVVDGATDTYVEVKDELARPRTP